VFDALIQVQKTHHPAGWCILLRVTAFEDYKATQIDAYAIYPQTRHLSQRVRAFVDFLVKRFEGTPYWDRCIKKSKS